MWGLKKECQIIVKRNTKKLKFKKGRLRYIEGLSPYLKCLGRYALRAIPISLGYSPKPETKSVRRSKTLQFSVLASRTTNYIVVFVRGRPSSDTFSQMRSLSSSALLPQTSQKSIGDRACGSDKPKKSLEYHESKKTTKRWPKGSTTKDAKKWRIRGTSFDAAFDVRWETPVDECESLMHFRSGCIAHTLRCKQKRSRFISRLVVK